MYWLCNELAPCDSTCRSDEYREPPTSTPVIRTPAVNIAWVKKLPVFTIDSSVSLVSTCVR